jgi:hypothetical protein
MDTGTKKAEDLKEEEVVRQYVCLIAGVDIHTSKFHPLYEKYTKSGSGGSANDVLADYLVTTPLLEWGGHHARRFNDVYLYKFQFKNCVRKGKDQGEECAYASHGQDLYYLLLPENVWRYMAKANFTNGLAAEMATAQSMAKVWVDFIK